MIHSAKRWIVWGLVVSLFPAGMAAAEQLVDVQKRLIELNGQIQSLAARISSGSELIDKSGSNKTETVGTLEWMERDGRQLQRTETRTVKTAIIRGKTTTVEIKQMEVSDGVDAILYQESRGQKTVMKQQPTSRPADPLATLKEKFDLVLLPDESIDGQSCWVIEARPRKDVPPTRAGNRSRHFFRKKDGVLAQEIYYDGRGGVTLTKTYHDIQVNSPIYAGRFTFEPPPDAILYEPEDAKPPPN